MKKIYLIPFLLLFFSISFGQNEKTTTFGFKGGVNFSDVNGIDSNGQKTGYVGTELYASLFSDTKLSEKWNFENELLFSYTDHYHLLEIPLHLKYKISDKWNFLFGPKLDFILDNDNYPIESVNRFKNFGVSIELGAQYKISEKLFVELRYSKGLTKQIDDLGLDINSGNRNTLRVGLGVKF